MHDGTSAGMTGGGESKVRIGTWIALFVLGCTVSAFVAGCSTKGKNPGVAASGDAEKKAQGKAMMEQMQQQRMQGGQPKSGKAGG